MKRILILLLGLFSVAYGQFSPTSAKTKFVNGLSIGSKDSTYFTNAGDTIVLYFGRDSAVYARFKGIHRRLAYAGGTDFVPYTGAVTNVNLGNYRLTARSIKTDSIYANSSAGMYLTTNSGSVVAHWGGGGSVEVDFKGFAGYDANRAGSYTARSFTDKNYVDSADALRLLKSDSATYYDKVVRTFGTQTIGGNKTFSNTISGTSISMSNEGLFGGAVTNGIDKLRVNGSGLFTGVTGETLKATGVAGEWTQRITGSSSTNNSYGLIVNGGTSTSDIAFKVTSQSGGTDYLVTRGDGITTIRKGIVSGGTGELLNINGNTGEWSQRITGSAASNNSYGLLIAAGTSSSDFALGVFNQGISSTLFTVRGDGAVNAPTSITSGSLIKTGGTSSQLLLANGSTEDKTNIYVGDATFDTTTRALTIPKLGGGSTSIVIPRGSASGASGITALSSSRTGNLVTVSGDNGSSTIFSVRDADSSSAMLYSDTSAMLSPYLRKFDTTAMLTPFVQYSDTSSLVFPYLRKSDTLTMLSNYARTSGLGSYAYRSSGLAELSGANFTGFVSAPKASISGSTGEALTVNGVVGEWATRVTGDSTALGDSYGLIVSAGTASTDIPFKVASQSGLTDYLVTRGDGLTTARKMVVSGGSGELLTVNGVAGEWSQRITGAASTGNSFGLIVNAGTNASDMAANILNQSGTTSLFNIKGDGSASFSSSVTVGGALSFSPSSSKIVSGITDFAIRNNADNTSMLHFNNSTLAATFTGSVYGIGFRYAYAAKSSNYTLTDNDDYINVTSSCTITLPTAVGRSGKRYVIKCTGSAVATIASTSSQTIDGNAASTYSFGGPNFNIMIVYSDGSNWFLEAWATGI